MPINTGVVTRFEPQDDGFLLFEMNYDNSGPADGGQPLINRTGFAVRFTNSTTRNCELSFVNPNTQELQQVTVPPGEFTRNTGQLANFGITTRQHVGQVTYRLL